ncbi:SMI1/KNR4 family protein [Bacteroides sp. UBA939]|uniref:SMI1/KNR4 family protein n=1 Tax=Bacteroides sp. UBA939 TaxID=1946092 RepID=UPI0025C26875|nr:SMI1/KNR4 family protein [Bacteroides sp. UBA939]
MKLEIDEIIKELMKFSDKLVDMRSPVDVEFIQRFETKYQIELPADYKYLLNKTNGFSLMGDEVLGITWASHGYDLVEVYRYEHFEVIIPQYKYLVPFSPDGRGNFYCFDTSVKTKNGLSNNIVFWCSNYEYTESDYPEITHNCLADFINECIIGWTLEDYNYDGSNK